MASIADLKDTLEGGSQDWLVHRALFESYNSLAETLLDMDKLDLAADASWLAAEHRREMRGGRDRDIQDIP